MNRKTVSGTMFTLLLTGMFVMAFHIQPVEAMETIYIRADGSIDPPTAPMVRDGDRYTLTDNITSDADGIVIERNNMTLDGAGYTVQGTGDYSDGIGLSGRSNVTINNVEIKAFYTGIFLRQCSSNTICRNIIEDMHDNGIFLYTDSDWNIVTNNNVKQSSGFGIVTVVSSHNDISNNSLIANGEAGISLQSLSDNNVVYRNNIVGNVRGFELHGTCSNNTVSGNNLEDNVIGINLIWSNSNSIYHNNLINNTEQAYSSNSLNVWDDGYLSGGNYWDNYNGTDLYSGSYQNETGFDWIGDAPYIIDEHNQDNYPLTDPYVLEGQDSQVAYRSLLGEYNELLSDFNSLNSTYHEILDDYGLIQGNYASLNSTYNDLLTSYGQLQSDYEAAIDELNNMGNLMYVFIATTIILIATTIHLALRKSKIKLQRR